MYPQLLQQFGSSHDCTYTATRSAKPIQLSSRRHLVLFGELFGRGYANGLIDEARKSGMTILGVTVGRRDENDQLRP
ncbi:MAG: hypothetical protein WCX90_10260 [Thiohalomonadaceae bacterium]